MHAKSKDRSLTTGSYEGLQEQKVQTKVELQSTWLSVDTCLKFSQKLPANTGRRSCSSCPVTNWPFCKPSRAFDCQNSFKKVTKPMKCSSIVMTIKWRWQDMTLRIPGILNIYIFKYLRLAKNETHIHQHAKSIKRKWPKENSIFRCII